MKSKLVLTIVLIVAALFSGWPSGWRHVSSAADAFTDSVQTIPLTNYLLTRNTGFNNGFTFWSKRGAGLNNAQVEANLDPQGGPAVRIFSESDANFATTSAIYQEIYLPDTITKATVNFKVKVDQAFEGQPPVQGELINGWWAIVPLDANDTPDLANSLVFGSIFDQTQSAFTDWLPYAVEIPGDFITALNSARANKQRLAFILGTLSNGWRFSLLVDDIDILVDGARTQPNFVGEIAYIWDGKIQRISPNGGNPQAVWTHPEDTYRLFNVRWNPAATELAFTSDHESPFSPFATDLYSISVDGTGLRRLTNGPSHAEMQASGLGRGSVRVSVTNNYNTFNDPVSFFRIYVQGAPEWGTITLPAQFGTTEVTIPNVVDLGENFLQHVVFIYSSSGCGAVRRYVPGFVDVVAGQTVNVDLAFDGSGCGLSGVREATRLSWKGDGSEIGFLVVASPFRIPATGSSGPGTPWWQGAGLTTSPAWSPVSNHVLYGRDLVGIERVEPDTEQGGTTLVPPRQGGYPDYPAWLPDGSGFLYVENGNLFYASAQGANIRQLTFFVNEFVHQPSISPDGAYVAFERQSGDFNLIWLMEWDNPTNMWPLVQGRRPDWSRVNPNTPVQPTNTPTPTATSPTAPPTATPPPGATSTPTPPPGNERVYLPAVQR